jgi:antitoxin component YwqK of YwqJK toxin-antitoxin module
MYRSSKRFANPAAAKSIALASNFIAAGALLALILASALPARAAEVVENYDGGTLHIRYQTDSQQKKAGKYEEFFANGKLKIAGAYDADQKTGSWITYDDSGKTIETATFEKGQLNGPFVRNFPSGKPEVQAQYRAGDIVGTATVFDENGGVLRRVTYPRTREAVAKSLAELYPKALAPPKFTTEPNLEAPYKAGELSAPSLDEALKVVKLYRFLSGMPWQNVAIDPKLSAKAQHGAVVLHKLGNITHTPSKPADMDEAFFKIAYAGCHESNLHMGLPSLPEAIDNLMDDSDGQNIGKVGHRQWILSPGLQRTGFGYADRFTAMHVIDGARASSFDYRFVAFPGEGYFPMALARPHSAWSVHLNAAKFQPLASGATVTVKLTRLDEAFVATDEVPVKIVSVLPPESMKWSTIIFSPQWKTMDAGKYWVEVSGIKSMSGTSTTIAYIVDLIGAGREKLPQGPPIIIRLHPPQSDM